MGLGQRSELQPVGESLVDIDTGVPQLGAIQQNPWGCEKQVLLLEEIVVVHPGELNRRTGAEPEAMEEHFLGHLRCRTGDVEDAARLRLQEVDVEGRQLPNVHEHDRIRPASHSQNLAPPLHPLHPEVVPVHGFPGAGKMLSPCDDGPVAEVLPNFHLAQRLHHPVGRTTVLTVGIIHGEGLDRLVDIGGEVGVIDAG